MVANGVRRLHLTQGYVATIDDADWEREVSCEFKHGLLWRGRVCELSWYAHVKPHTVYVSAKLCAGLQIRLHRAICCAGIGQIVDHIDHDGLNNRRENLRVTDAAGNARNRSSNRGRQMPKGVGLHRSGKYESYIRYQGKKLHLGLYADLESAAARYRAKAAELFGEFASAQP